MLALLDLDDWFTILPLGHLDLHLTALLCDKTCLLLEGFADGCSGDGCVLVVAIDVLAPFLQTSTQFRRNR